MRSHLRPAVVVLVVMTALTGIAYPLALTGLAGLLFPDQAAGSLLHRNGQVVGSALIGQSFTAARYFHPRPSATTATDPNDASKTVPAPYKADNSSGSNLGPTAKALADRVRDDIAHLRAENPDAHPPGDRLPADLLTTSASGLDPHISPAAAAFQIPRVAKAWHLADDAVAALVAAHTEEPLLGLLGERRVNVLTLTLALDAAAK